MIFAKCQTIDNNFVFLDLSKVVFFRDCKVESQKDDDPINCTEVMTEQGRFLVKGNADQFSRAIENIGQDLNKGEKS